MLVVSVFFFGWTSMNAQDDIINYEERNFYEIGGITIEGAGSRDQNAIKSIAALKEGSKFQIPGTAIPNAIKALLKLRLFDDVQVYADKFEGDVVFLRMVLVERPVLTRWTFKGVKTSKHDDLNDIVKGILTRGGIVTDDQKDLAKLKLKEYFIGKGLLDAKIDVVEVPEEARTSSVRLIFEIYQGQRIKIEEISFEGNEKFSDRKLKKKLKRTKQKGTFLRKSKYIEKEYQNDLLKLTQFYRKEGYKNMTIVKDTVYRTKEGAVKIDLGIDEGRRHYFRDIKWKGNLLYTDEYLYTVLGISKGDVYNPELLDNRLKFSLDGRDISSLYLDDGYLAFDVTPVEIAVENDSVDVEMRIFEGPQFTVDNVVIAGNDRTNENVIRRELRTLPGQKFSRSQIIRSQREIINLGYFDPENLGIETPVNQNRGTVGVEYNLEEKPSDQLELSAGYGGFSGLIGTLGVVFNNFSIANVKDRSTWSPLPQGDGQKLSLRLQSNSRFYKSYNASFTEPWLGGKKPRSFTIGGYRTAFDYSTISSGKLDIARFFIGIGSQLKWPDDYFSTQTTLNIERIKLDNFIAGGFPVSIGNFNNFSVQQTITRSSVSDPLYPRSGSRISVSLQVTPPYSLFRKDNTFEVDDAQRADIIRDLAFENGPARPVTDGDINRKINELKEANKFKWLEYHKWKISSEWYFNLFDKFVVGAFAKIGILEPYNNDVGVPPFERFQLGGDGINNQNIGLQGIEIISLRGYDVGDIIGNGTSNSSGQTPGAPIYNKFTLEARYPLSLNPNSTIFVTGWLQGGNAYETIKKYNPFDLKRSAGFGARVFLPMFGLLGFDYGWGFDKTLSGSGSYGKFNIVLGFEPE